MATRTDDGSSVRDHLEASARRGNQNALAELEPPECPYEVSYLADWVWELTGRSGSGLNGPDPLSYTTIEAWARLLNVEIRPYEVQALILLDTIVRNPDAFVDKDEPETLPQDETPGGGWPERKRPAEFVTEED